MTWEAYELFKVGEQGTRFCPSLEVHGHLLNESQIRIWPATRFRHLSRSVSTPMPAPRLSLISLIFLRPLLRMANRMAWEAASFRDMPDGGLSNIATRAMALKPLTRTGLRMFDLVKHGET